MAYDIQSNTIIDDNRNIVGANSYNGYIPVNPTLTISAANGLVGGGTLAANRSLYVRAGDGVTVNTTGVHVVGGAGISVNTSSVSLDTDWMKTRYTSLVSAEGSSNTLHNNIGLTANTVGATAFWHSQGNRPSDAPYNAQGGGIAVGSALWSSPGIIHFSGTNLSYSPPGSSTWRNVAFSDDLNGFANSATQIIAGSGLTGGGSLVANRTLSVGQGDGILVGATTVGVDDTVVRTTGDQSIAGIKTFSGEIRSSIPLNYRITNGTKSAFQHINADNYYILFSDTTTGTFNAIRPFMVSLANGAVTISNGLTWSGTATGSISGSAASLTTARTLTLGASGKTFNGTANVSWTLAEMGAAPSSGSSTITTLGTVTSGIWNAGAITSSGTIAAANGTATAPAFDFTSDPNTGMYLSAADTLSFATNGTIAATITPTGNMRLYNTGGTFYTEIANQPTANRTLTLPADGNTTLVAGTMVPNTIQVIAGNGLSGGGTLAANRTFAVVPGDGILVNSSSVSVDSDSVVRTFGAQLINDKKTFTTIPGTTSVPSNGTDLTTKNYVDANFVPIAGDTVINGNKRFSLPLKVGSATTNEVTIQTSGGHMFLDAGGTGGHVYVKSTAGDFRLGFVTTALTANRSLTFPDASVILVSGTMVPTTLTLTAGNGLTGGGNLTTNRTFAVGQGDGITVAATTVGVDATVVRTTGNQSIAGTKTFTGIIDSIGQGASWGSATATPSLLSNSSGGDTTATWAFRFINGSNNKFGGIQYHNGPTTNQVRLYTGNTEFILFTDSLIASAHIGSDIARSAIQVIAGNGLSGGGTLAANRTLAVGAGNGITVNATSVSVSTDYSNAKGGGNNNIFFENDTTVTASYTIPTGKNAMTAGPITINNGVTITIPNGQAWSVV